MIKRISQQNFLTTPFVTTKEWSLANIINDDVVLIEQTGSMGEDQPVAMDYLDYYGGSPFLERDCDIALEQQSDDDVLYREGEKLDGHFYPETDPKNLDGTYKRLIYSQINAAFYNTRRNPVEIFGMENIEFPLSKTNRYISDFFREFLVPQAYFGDRLKAGTVELYDNSIDDNVTITDDSYGNLLAYPNLFSKIQEVRSLGNSVYSGSAAIDCPLPIVDTPNAATNLTASLTASISGAYAISPYEVNLNWTDNSTIEDGFYIWRALMATTTWTAFSNIASVGPSVTTYQDIIATTIASASYYVQAYNIVGTATGSNIVYVTASAPV
jgi:hypothetical protein